jgi:hypothetical protein
MSATMTVDSTALNLALNDWIKATKEDASEVIKTESRLFAKMAMKLTPPKGPKQGEETVENDILKIIGVASEGLIRRVVESADSASSMKVWMARKDGTPYLIEWDSAQLDDSGLKEFHKKHRNSRGRVKAPTSRNRKMVPVKVRRDYINKVKENVGRLKAGWLPALARFPKSGKPERAPAKWITRHKVGALGNAILLGDKTVKVTSVMTNRAGGAKQLIKIVKDTLRARLNAITRRLKLHNSGYSKDMAAGMRMRSRARKRGGK